jgi:hypothetical protein
MQMRTSALMIILAPQGWSDEDHVFGSVSLASAFTLLQAVQLQQDLQYA